MRAMERVVITEPGGPEKLGFETVAVPDPGPGDLLVRVAAAGLNGPDLLQRRGLYVPALENAQRPGLEISGIVTATGAKTHHFKPGDRVIALTNGAGYAEYVTVPEAQTLPAPDGWRLSDAAALPETFFTIEQALVMRAGLEKGMSVLVHGASGGLGGAALQIAHLFGAETIASVSTPEKAEYVRRLGADHVIDHTQEDVVARVHDITNGRGVDRIVDVIGGASLRRNLEMAAPGGVIVALAYLGGARGELIFPLLLSRNLTLIGSVLGPQPGSVKAEIARRLKTDVWPGLDSGAIVSPHIRVFSFSEVVDAHRAMEDKTHYGKIVLVTPFGTSVE